MSRTNIVPPQSFSVQGPYVVASYSKLNPNSPWTGPNVTRTTHTDTTGTVTRSGTVTSGFQRASDVGDLPENSFSYTRSQQIHFRGTKFTETVGSPPGSFKSRTIAAGTFLDEFVVGFSVNTINSLRRSNLDNEVKQKVLAKVLNQSVNVAVFYAEREQTAAMLASSLKRLGKAYNLAKKGRILDASIALTGHKPRGPLKQTISQNWLELQYGWLPLMSDIYGACETLQRQMTHREFVVVRSSKEIQEDEPRRTISSDGSFVDYILSSAHYTSSVRVKMKSNSTLLRTASELGLANPGLVAWELVPFSFVVDWALPIGSFISQFTAALGWEFHTGSISRFYRQKANLLRTPYVCPANYVEHVFEGTRSLEEISFTREGIGSWAEMLTLPYIKDPASFVHIANALALLTQKR